MTLHSPLRRYDRPPEDRSIAITWEPHLPRTHLRLRALEQATVIQVSANGALIRAHTNPDINRSMRVSIGRGSDRGLVAVRRIEQTSDDSISHYGVQFLWLDPKIQAVFDDAVSSEFHYEWQ
ncbi:MAG: hypothetical protein ABIQ73_11600 [Acidimicrobiales bacterium]